MTIASEIFLMALESKLILVVHFQWIFLVLRIVMSLTKFI